MSALVYLAVWILLFALSSMAVAGVHGCSDLPAPNGLTYVALSRGPSLPIPALQGCHASAAPVFIVLAVAYGSLTAAWLWVLRSAVSLKAILAAAILANVAAIAFPYVSTSDAYAYALYAYEAGVLHLSPYAAHALPATQTGLMFAQLFPDAHSDIRVMNYGPVFAFAYAAVGAIFGGSLTSLVYGERIFSAICVAVTGFLLSRARSIVQSRRALVLVLLSPLLLIEGVAFAHGDAFMLALLVAALLFWERGRVVETGAFIGLAIGVRSVALFALLAATMYLYRAQKARITALWVGALSAIGLSAIVSYVVFGAVSFGGGAAIDPFGSPVAVVTNLVGGISFSHTVIATGIQAALGMSLIAVALLANAYEYVPAGALAATPSLRPWYCQWLMPALALPSSRTARRISYGIVTLAILGEAPLMIGDSKMLAVGIVLTQWAFPLTIAIRAWSTARKR